MRFKCLTIYIWFSFQTPEVEDNILAPPQYHVNLNKKPNI